jgi:polyisoprenyl-teichoic acid--peptidoglycan teichoic acid transferase
MRKKLTILILFLLLTLPACQVFSNVPGTTPPEAQTLAAQTIAAGQVIASPTPTLEPSPTPTATATVEMIPGEGVPGEASPLEIPEGAQTILLMGSDQRPNAGDFRTDTMVLLVLKKDGSASLVSFPRDLWVFLPGKSMQRINASMEFGGFELVKATFEYNFGFAPQSFVLTNFSGFKSIVDSLGGIDVWVGASLSDARDGFPDGFTVDPGTVHMDGETALWYVRSRKTTSDLDRLRRSQEVLFSIGRKLLSLNGLARVPEFYKAYRNAVVTDLTLDDMLGLLPLLQVITQDKIQRYAISSDQIIPYVTSQGADVLLPKPQAIRDLLVNALGE